MPWPSIVLVLSFFLFSFRLNSYPLLNWDEAWYAEIIRNSVSGKHNILMPFWNGQYFLDKPPLYFWLTFPIVKFFGIGEWQVRLVGVLAASLAVLFTYFIGRFLFSKKAGLLAALVFASLGHVLFRFSSAALDSLMIFLFLASFYFFLRSPKHRWSIFFSGVFLGLSLLVKSWLLGLFPAGLIVLYALLVDQRYLKKLFPLAFVALIFGGWWYLWGSFAFGSQFVQWFILSPGAGNFFNHQIILKSSYLIDLVSDIGLWFFPLVVCIPVFKKINHKDRLTLFIFAAYSLIYFFILLLSSDQYGWYLLPLYPFLALIFGCALGKVDLRKNKLVLSLVILSFFGQIFLQIQAYRHDPDRSLVGAQLGQFARQKIKSSETVVLDDQDFSAFLYYSNLQKIIVVLPSGGKPQEYWIKSYNQLESITRPFWLVTRDWQNKGLGIPVTIITAPDGYRLVKFDSTVRKF